MVILVLYVLKCQNIFLVNVLSNPLDCFPRFLGTQNCYASLCTFLLANRNYENPLD
jgi:hypothetical protein